MAGFFAFGLRLARAFAAAVSGAPSSRGRFRHGSLLRHGLRRHGLRLRGLLHLELLHRRKLLVDRVVVDRRRDLHDVGLQRAQLGGQPARVLAQAVHQRAELVVHRAEPLEQLAGGGRDAVDVVARLLPGLGAQLVGGRLGGFEDLLDTRDDAAAATGWPPRPRRFSTSSATWRRWASTASGS